MNPIKKMRWDRDWTQYDLASMVGVTTKTIRAWESGQNVPNFWHLPKLAKAFGVSPEFLKEQLKCTVKV